MRKTVYVKLWLSLGQEHQHKHHRLVYTHTHTYTHTHIHTHLTNFEKLEFQIKSSIYVIIFM
jgi:ABC-type nickel/cobalt efflux system permease component RcnA